MPRPVRMFTLHVSGAEIRLVGDAPLGTAQPALDRSAAVPQGSEGPEEAYFADGIVDDIIYALAGLKELFVVSRGSTLGYGGEEVDVRAIGDALGVRYVLYGSVRRAAGRLRIATELSDAETGTSSGPTSTRASFATCLSCRTASRPASSARSRRMCSSTNWSGPGASIRRT